MSRRRPRGKGDWIDTLPPDVRSRYENEVLADPRTTARAARKWLLDQGVSVSLPSVLRHRNWWAREQALRARARSAEDATQRLAAEAGLTADELAAGRDLRNARRLFDTAHDLFKKVYHGGEPAPPEQFLALARTLRALIG